MWIISLCSNLFWCLLISFDFTVFQKKKSKYSHCTREQKEFSSWGISLGWVYFGGVFCCFIGVFSSKLASIDHSWSPEFLLRLKTSPTGQGRIYLATSLHSEQLPPMIPWVGADVRTDFSKKIINTKSFHTIITLGKKTPGCTSSNAETPAWIWTDYLVTEILWVHHKSTAGILAVVCSKCTRCLADWSQELRLPWLQKKVKSLYVYVLIYNLPWQYFHR